MQLLAVYLILGATYFFDESVVSTVNGIATPSSRALSVPRSKQWT
jgi:hypothetical protein